MKKLTLLMILCVLISSFIPITTSKELEPDHTIINNTISKDDSSIYISATPHTLGSSGWVEIKVISKTYSGNIDCMLGFTDKSTQPTIFQQWKNTSHQTTINKVVTKEEPISFFDLNLSKWINSSRKVDSLKPVTTEEWYYDWTEVGNFANSKYDINGKDLWYTISNVNVQAGVEYKFRVWIDIPFSGLDKSTGEYYFAVKPSTKTITESIDDKSFKYLDPWWDTDWGCRVPIIIDHDYVDTVIDDYPILVVLNATLSAQCNSGKSLRFTLDDNSTLLNFEIENYTSWNPSGTNYVWVNVTTIKAATDTLIWMYYNNAGATDGQNVADTWDGWFQGVWHFNESSYLWDSTSNGNHGTKVNTPTDASGIANGVIDFDKASSEYYNMGNVCDQTTNLFTAEGWYNASREYTDEQTLMNKKWSGTNKWYIQIDDSGAGNDVRFACIDAEDDVVTADPTGTPPNGLWKYFVASRNADQYFSLMIMDVAYKKVKGNTIKTGAISTLTNTDDLCFASYTGGGDYYANCLDEFRISNIARNNTYQNLTFEVIHNNSDVIKFGVSDCSYAITYEIIWSFDTPANGTEVCPCCFPINFTVSHTGSYIMNITIWSNYSGSWEIVNHKLVNLTNGTYGVCIHDFDRLDYRYYFNATIDDGGSNTNKTGIYWIETFGSVNSCNSTSTGTSTSYAWTVAPSIFGIIAFIFIIDMLYRRKRRNIK